MNQSSPAGVAKPDETVERAPTLGALAGGRVNNFRIIRLAAASAVILSHSYMVNGGAAAISQDLLERITTVDSGEFAVDVFFVTSGFLVSRSLVTRGGVRDYLAARVLRITPALTISVLLGAFLLGPLTTELPLRAYFAAKSLYTYVLINSLSLSPFHMRSALPGVFHHLPIADVVDAPLWTLPWEIWMYGVLLFLFLVRGLGRAFPLLLGLALAAYTAMALGWWMPGTYGSLAVRFVAFFFSGVAMQVFAPRIPISPKVLAAATAAFLVANVATQSTVLLPEWLAYATLFVAYAPRLVVARWSIGPDYSYGMYIYAYMVQQTLVWKFGPHAPMLNAVAALVLTLPIAMLSWHFIEEPALGLKQRLRKKAPRADSAEGAAW